MSSRYSCSPDDDFFESLNESLTNEYSSQMITNFMSELIVSISNLDDDPEEDFIFYDDENHYSNGTEVNNISVDMFDDDDDLHLISLQKNESNMTPEKDEDNESVDMFDDEPHHIHVHEKEVPLISEKEWDTVSVDMFDDEPYENQVHEKEVAIILEKESDAESVDMLLEYETDMEVIDVDSTCSETTNINEHPDVLVFPNDNETVVEDSDRTYIAEQRDVGEFLNDRQEMEQVEFPHNIDTPLDFSIDENHLRLNDFPSNHKSLSPEIESEESVENAGNEQLSQNSDILVCVPSNISYCDDDERSLEVPLETPQAVHRTIQTTRSDISNFHDVSFTKEKSHQDSECDSAGCRRVLLPFNVIANTSLEGSDFGGFLPADLVNPMANIVMSRRPIDSSSRFPFNVIANTSLEGSDFGGFLPVDLVGHMADIIMSRTDTDHSSRFNPDLNTSLCEEYETTNDFLPDLRSFSPAASLRPRSLSRSTNFSALSHVASIHQNVQHLTRSLSRNESDLDTTLCEEYETFNSLIAEMNETQTGNFNLEEAYSQCFLDSQNQANPNADRRQFFIDEIEKLTLKLTRDLACGGKLVIPTPYRVSWNKCDFNNGRLSLRALSNDKNRVIKSPRKIALILYVLSFIHDLLINNKTCTKREIYYSDPKFTESQAVVADVLMDIGFILNARPWDLGVFSSSKGLIAGSIKLILSDDTVLDVERIEGGILLPHQTVNIKKVETKAKFVLVVEKHTIYEKLLVDNILTRLGPCILVTGKGYPDINTRTILKKIWDDCKCPTYALVDADPDGIEIMLTYRHGSLNMSFLNADLALPSLRWIGVYPSEIKKLRLQSLPLTERDNSRIDSMVKRHYISTQIFEELMILKKVKRKAELESLTANGMVDWIGSYLFNKIQSGVFI